MLLSLAVPALIMAESVSSTGACLRCTVTCQANTDALQPTGVNDTMAGRSMKQGWSAQLYNFGYVFLFITVDK